MYREILLGGRAQQDKLLKSLVSPAGIEPATT
jgi:hypothetical protein